MRGDIPLLPQYAFMAWCSVKNTGTDSIFTTVIYYLFLPKILLMCIIFMKNLMHIKNEYIGSIAKYGENTN
jgi:membrane glycosyltransferase